jgi:hypothetical protein
MDEKDSFLTPVKHGCRPRTWLSLQTTRVGWQVSTCRGAWDVGRGRVSLLVNLDTVMGRGHVSISTNLDTVVGRGHASLSLNSDTWHSKLVRDIVDL